MKTIYFVRHGESEGNVAGVLSGKEHDALLTDKGRAQARAAGQELQDKKIELIVCSPMKRTVATAEHIAETIGYDPKKIVTNVLFIERAFGPISGKLSEPYIEAFARNEPPKGVETSEEMHVRVSKALAWLKTLPEARILVVSHGVTGRMVKVVAQELHHGQLNSVERLNNAEVYEFTL